MTEQQLAGKVALVTGLRAQHRARHCAQLADDGADIVVNACPIRLPPMTSLKNQSQGATPSLHGQRHRSGRRQSAWSNARRPSWAASTF